MLEGFRDCHCHLLPGVDDGVKKMAETMLILEEWETWGVQEVWLTPHIMEDMPNMPGALKDKFEELTTAYRGSIKLHLAAEHMMDGPFAKRLEDGDVMPYNGKLLVETSYYIPPMNMKDMVERVKSQGYVPVLAHPERYQYMNTKDYRHWKEHGVLLQLNVPSLVGAYGPEVQHKAEWLLKENMYDYCGTDTHSFNQVNFFLSSAIGKKNARKVTLLAEAQEL